AVCRRVVEKNALAFATEREARVQAGRGDIAVQPNDDVTARRDAGARWEDEPPRVAVVTQAPTGEIHRRATGVVQLDPVRERTTVRHRAGVVGHDLIEPHGTECGRRGETAWRTIVARAGPPVGGIVGIAE